MIIGMAGHVDHGKSALVTALTGRPMDRLAEERRRGITIDLNFASLELVPGLMAGVIDVPGHEDFVRTMVAGASGIDVAILVVAADEGIMPQTREHLLVLEQLRVPAGVVVLTKADAVDPDWLELVGAEVSEWLAGSVVPFGEPMVTSAKTGEGVDALRARLGELAVTNTVREVHDLFRLPVDRVFTVAGTGTVVTGTAMSGSVAVGDAVLLQPSGREARVRSIESYGRSLERSMPGARTAVALSGVERDDIARGDVLVLAAEPWEPSTRIDVEVTLAADATALADQSRVRVHHGTAEVMARLRLDTALQPGRGAVARLTLESPLVARGTDRLVLRSYSPVTVIGGGRILDPLPGSRRHVPGGLDSSDPAARLESLVERRRAGVELRLIPVLLGLPPPECEALVRNSLTLMPAGELLVRRSEVERLAGQLVREVEGFHGREPHEVGISVETLRHSLRVPDAVAEAALGEAERGGRLRVQAGVVSLPSFRVVPRASLEDQQRLVSAVKRAGLTAPLVAEVAAGLGLTLSGRGLEAAALGGHLVRVEPGRYLAREALEEFAAVVREVGALGEITPGLLRDRTGLSRKFLIPLLEWADRSGITYREGDVRRLRAPRPGAAPGA
jgi:selenocysteine-specific elongation factor